MKKAVTRGILYIIIVFIPILAVDYYVDSYLSFRLTYKKLGEIAVESNYCVGADIPLSERKAKWAQLLYMEPVDYMIVGSSRSILLSSENLGVSSFYNAGVFGGSSVRDYLAETYILYRQDKLPENMLIEISPSIFNANSGETRWNEWGNSYRYMKELLSGKNKKREDSRLLGVQMKDLLSPAYFKYNLKQLKEGKRAVVIKNGFEDDELLNTWHVDGSFAYSRQEQTKNDEEAVRKLIREVCDSRSIYCCSDFHELDDSLIDEFQQLIGFLDGQGVNIAFYLPPYTEDMYDYICHESCYESILKVEEYILDYGAQNGIQVYGSYDPRKSGLELKDFYDEYHIRTEKVKDTLWIRNSAADNLWIK